MHLKQLVNDKECYEQFQQHIDDLINLRQRALETASEPHVIHRQQGATGYPVSASVGAMSPSSLILIFLNDNQ